MPLLFLLLAILPCYADIHVQLSLQNAPGMDQEKFALALESADLSFAGEPFSRLVAYEDRILGIRSLPGQCAAGYYSSLDKCLPCECAPVVRAMTKVNFKPL